jgi:hypothetical protein
MKDVDLFNNVYQSVVKWVQDWRETQTVASKLKYVNWDAHAELSELPEGNLVGPAMISLREEEEGIYLITFSIGVCVVSDPNHFTLTKMISELRGLLKPTTRMAVYDHDSTEPATWMVVVTPQEVSPPAKAEMRSVRFLNVQALLDPGAASGLRAA